jgi:hypothetical protein
MQRRNGVRFAEFRTGHVKCKRYRGRNAPVPDVIPSARRAVEIWKLARYANARTWSASCSVSLIKPRRKSALYKRGQARRATALAQQGEAHPSLWAPFGVVGRLRTLASENHKRRPGNAGNVARSPLAGVDLAVRFNEIQSRHIAKLNLHGEGVDAEGRALSYRPSARNTR